MFSVHPRATRPEREAKMSLFNKIATATGNGDAIYAKAGRHLVTLTKIFYVDPADDPTGKRTAPLLGFKGRLINSNRSDFGQPGNAKGDVVTVNDGCKFIDTALARFRRGLAAAKASKEGLANCDERTLGLVQGENESDKEFHKRLVTEAQRLGGVDQPLVDALVTFVCTEKVGMSGSTYTLFVVELPSEVDLKNAGLI